MAEIKPIVLYGNKPKELQIGDTIPQIAVTDLVIDLQTLADDMIALSIAL